MNRVVIIDGSEWSLLDQQGELSFWQSEKYHCTDNTPVRVWTTCNDYFEIRFYSGSSYTVISKKDFINFEGEIPGLNLNEDFENQCLLIADYLCRKLLNIK